MSLDDQVSQDVQDQITRIENFTKLNRPNDVDEERKKNVCNMVRDFRAFGISVNVANDWEEPIAALA